MLFGITIAAIIAALTVHPLFAVAAVGCGIAAMMQDTM